MVMLMAFRMPNEIMLHAEMVVMVGHNFLEDGTRLTREVARMMLWIAVKFDDFVFGDFLHSNHLQSLEIDLNLPSSLTRKLPGYMRQYCSL
jgi:hypothetical protein